MPENKIYKVKYSCTLTFESEFEAPNVLLLLGLIDKVDFGNINAREIQDQAEIEILKITLE